MSDVIDYFLEDGFVWLALDAPYLILTPVAIIGILVALVNWKKIRSKAGADYVKGNVLLAKSCGRIQIASILSIIFEILNTMWCFVTAIAPTVFGAVLSGVLVLIDYNVSEVFGVDGELWKILHMIISLLIGLASACLSVAGVALNGWQLYLAIKTHKLCEV